MSNSQIHNMIDGVHGLRVKRSCCQLHERESVCEAIIKYIKKYAESSKKIKVYVEDLRFLCNKEFLLYLYQKLDLIDFSIYVNDISFRELLKGEERESVVLDEFGYIKEELYINEQLLNDDTNYVSDINFLNALYSVDKNQGVVEGNKKFTIYFNTNNKIDKIFSSFMENVKKSAKRTNIFTIKVKPAFDHSSALSASSGILDFTVDVFEIGPLVDCLINDLKEHIKKYNSEMKTKYGIDIQISDERYDSIKESLIAIFNFIFLQASNLKKKYFFDIVSNIVLFNYEDLISSLVSLFVKGCLGLIDSKYAEKSETVLKRLLNNNILFYKFVEILGSDLLFVLNYQTGIKGSRIDVDDNLVILLPKLIDKYSILPFYSMQFTLYDEAELQELGDSSKAVIHLDNQDVTYNGKSISSKELMLINNIKSLKYLLFAETPSYFLPYMDNLLKENFNYIQSSEAKYNTTGKDINVIVFTSLLSKWQEKYIKRRMKDKYGAVPVRYKLPSKDKKDKRNISYDSYKDYDIILKNSVIQDKPVSKITYLTYFNRIDVQSLQNDLNYTVDKIRGILDKLQEYISRKPGNRSEYYEEKFSKLFTVFSELCKISNISKIFKGFDNSVKFINKRSDKLRELKNSFATIKDIYIDVKQSYGRKMIRNDIFPYDDIVELNGKIDYFISMITLIEKYFFSKADKDNILTFTRDYAYNVDEFLREIILEEHRCSIIEYRYDCIDSASQVRVKDLLLCSSSDEYSEVKKLLKYVSLDTSKYDLSYLRYKVMRLHYNLDSNIKSIEKELNGQIRAYTSVMKDVTDEERVVVGIKDTVKNKIPNFPSNTKYSELEDLGRSIWEEVNRFVESSITEEGLRDRILDSHFKCVLILKKQFLLHIFVDDEVLSRYLYDYEERLFYIVTGMYFSTKFHNHLLSYMLVKINIFDENMRATQRIFMDTFKLYCLEELYIISNHLYEDRVLDKSIYYSGPSYINGENIFELDDISEEYISMLSSVIRSHYDNFDYLKKSKYRNEDEYVYKDSIAGYGSSLYKNYRGERSKLEHHMIDIGSPDFKLSVFDEAFNVSRSAKYVKILIKEKFSLSKIVNIGLIAYGLYSVHNISSHFQSVLKNIFIKTIDEKSVERYMNYVKYTHLMSHKQPPLVKVSNNELILPGSVHNNMMLFDNSYGIFGGSALDMMSFVNNDVTYANVYDENITRCIFSDRIKRLILGVNYNSNRLVSSFWNCIEYIEPKEVDFIKARQKADEYIKANELVDKRVEEYSLESKKKRKLVEQYRKVYEDTLLSMLTYIFIIGYYTKYIVDDYAGSGSSRREETVRGESEEDCCKYDCEPERASIYQLFTESLHGVGRCNLRSIYVEDIGEVAEMFYELDNKVSCKTVIDEEFDREKCSRIRYEEKKVCHLDYAGMLSILPIEDSHLIIGK